jgi:hypothetical protein
MNGQESPQPIDRHESSPVRGPGRVGQLAAIAAGAWTDIVGIYGPAQAALGELVSIRVDVKNLASYGIYIALTGQYDGVSLSFSPDYAGVDPGATYSFTASFTMPNKDIKLDIWSFFWTGTEWYQDDHEVVYISLKELTPEFYGFGITDYSKR